MHHSCNNPEKRQQSIEHEGTGALNKTQEVGRRPLTQQHAVIRLGILNGKWKPLVEKM